MPPAAAKRTAAAASSGNERKLYLAAVSVSTEPGTFPLRAKRFKQLGQITTRLGYALYAKAAFLLALDQLLETCPTELLVAAGRLQGDEEASQGAAVQGNFAKALEAAHKGAATRGSAQCAALLGFLVDGLRARGWEARLRALLERPASHWHDPADDVLAADPRAALVDKVRPARPASLVDQLLACLLLA